MPEPVCVRCGGPVGLTVDVPTWHCPTHGEVEPLHAPLPAEHYHLHDVASSSAVPVWIPLPLPAGWAVSGRTADRRHRPRREPSRSPTPDPGWLPAPPRW